MRSASLGSRQKMRNAWSKIGALLLAREQHRRHGPVPVLAPQRELVRAGDLERAHAVDDAVGADAHARRAQQAREMHHVLGKPPLHRFGQAAAPFSAGAASTHSRAIFSTAGEAEIAWSRK